MSDKQRWPAASARQIADELVAELAPRCKRIDIAGSLRRGKPEVGDIELLYMPCIGQVRMPGELFPRSGSLADELIEQWLTRRVLSKRLNVNGSHTWGVQNKQAVHVASGVPIDLFATTGAGWFVSLVFRTGSKKMTNALAARARDRGMQLHACDLLEVTATGEQIIPQSEREVFERLGVPYREPAQW